MTMFGVSRMKRWVGQLGDPKEVGTEDITEAKVGIIGDLRGVGEKDMVRPDQEAITMPDQKDEEEGEVGRWTISSVMVMIIRRRDGCCIIKRHLE